MNVLYQIQQLRVHVAKNKLGIALEKLRELISSSHSLEESYFMVLKDFQNEITIQSSYFTRVEEFNRKNQIKPDDYNRSINEISDSFLKTIQEIEEKLSSKDIFSIQLGENNADIEAGFKMEAINDALAKTTELIKKAKHFRVVGIGRQYVGDVRNSKNIKNYYSAIENRLIDNSIEDRFRYRRITIMELKDEFSNHLHKCFENSEKSENGNRTEVILLEDIEMQFTYYIIDTDVVVINIYTYSAKDNVLDCPIAYWSTDSTTVNSFISHFDRIWRRENRSGNIITSKKEYEQYVPFNKDILKGLKEIKNSIKKLPKKSARTDWAVKELEQTKSRLKGLTEYSLGIKNKETNGKLLSMFSYYVKKLTKGDEYLTISFLEFWEKIETEDTRKFYLANRTALMKGAKITRIYIINSNKINQDEYRKKQREILEKHFSLKRSYNDYKFKLLFIDSEKYMRYLLGYKNFAIWTSKKETILFMPEYIDSTTESLYPTMTYLYYTDEANSDHPNFQNNFENISNAKIDFEEIEKDCNQQKNLNQEQIMFLEFCNIQVKEVN